MRTICPKIFVKLDFFAAMSLFCTENILSISDISSTLPLYPVLKILEN